MNRSVESDRFDELVGRFFANRIESFYAVLDSTTRANYFSSRIANKMYRKYV